MKTGMHLIHDINECTVSDNAVAFWWLGQAGFVVKLGKTIIYLDPFLAEHPERTVASLLKPHEVINADYIVGSHDHLDHINREVWHQLSVSSPNAKFVVPKLLLHSLSTDLDISEERMIGLDDGVSVCCSENFKISAIAAAHEFLDQDVSTGNYPYLSFIIEGNGCTLYHAGDTCIYEGMISKLKEQKPFTIMFLPINGRGAIRYSKNILGNMTYQEAVDLAGTIHTKLAVPCHYEMFESNSENPLLFLDYLKAKFPKVQCWIGEHGERVVFENEANLIE
ncbi:MAG: MBL fold metallo-hydrolase [Lachnotalea sp.]